MAQPQSCELTILMPCLNEAETLEVCIRKALGYLERSGVDGEVLIADNGSTDGSQEIARLAGARVVPVAEKGYGSALIGGIAAARGTYVIMGDADDSYDFSSLDPFVAKLREGYQLVMGNRFRGGIAPGAMPPLHKYLGNPVLSGIGARFFKPGVRDFHCGLRGFDRQAILGLGLRTSGMEFASEMVVEACLAKLRIVEVPTTLSKDGRTRPPHLRSWHDGWRHLRFLLVFSPKWLFFYPGAVLFAVGILANLVLLFGPVEIGSVGFDVSTMIYATAAAVVGYQAVLFAILTKVFAEREGFLPAGPRFRAIADRLTLERGLLIGLALFVLGLAVAVTQVLRWGSVDFGGLDARSAVRIAVPAALGLMLGFQTMMSSMFVGILTIPTRARSNPPAPEAVPDDVAELDLPLTPTGTAP
ncbi:glycosyltransferase family 2 protein [Cellulomonas fengjieae]|uniref:Glycosyltransferase family 2 protein n=1 Tax=Cellulomonas fengjieae TaxID=2819978 RepID=A0ABS3SDL8_9CELL|nr:glycosyltransferase family 2 protein [Cellulomonas fengjieae]MBO3083851.1 glycosyltransferase family 2 protein [Cellulomonas fengjieae]MBO3101400.1 glycosyltransferase family 2 protein [Cellulomonas fengjieae]QVI64863.1 glycosyltransferase family 2 protein [Cellulomonas fengjieae]